MTIPAALYDPRFWTHPLYTLRGGPDHFPHAELARLLALAAGTVAAAC